MATSHYVFSIQAAEGEVVSPGGIAEVIRWAESSIAGSVAMAFQLRSSLKGSPDWLQAAAAIRFVGADVQAGNAELSFATEAFGETAASYYRQPTLFWTPPDPEETGFEVLASIMRDVAARLVDSRRFDAQLLRRVASLRRFSRYGVEAVTISGGRLQGREALTVNADVLKQAAELSKETPPPVASRVMGSLDTIRSSDASFIMTLHGGERLHGLWLPADRTQLGKLWGGRIVIEGTAIFRPSGALLRVEAKLMRKAEESEQFFSVVPQAHAGRKTMHTQALRLEPSVDLAGWPGVEGDEEILAGIRRLGGV